MDFCTALTIIFANSNVTTQGMANYICLLYTSNYARDKMGPQKRLTGFVDEIIRGTGKLCFGFFQQLDLLFQLVLKPDSIAVKKSDIKMCIRDRVKAQHRGDTAFVGKGKRGTVMRCSTAA